MFSQQTIHIHMEKSWTSHWCFPNIITFEALQAGCAWLHLEASKPEEEQKPEETYWVIVCWVMRCAAVGHVLYFSLVKIAGEDWGIGDIKGNVNKDEMLYDTSKLYFINTTVSSGPQIDPCSLIPWNILHCTIAFCSSFVFWLICHYKCDMIWLHIHCSAGYRCFH